jgi:hypothetical protein
MRGQNNNGRTGVISFAHPVEQADRSNNQLDEAGRAILQLLGRAADIAEGNNRQAIDKAQKLSHQLHAAEDRIREPSDRRAIETCLFLLLRLPSVLQPPCRWRSMARAGLIEQWLRRAYSFQGLGTEPYRPIRL